MARVATWNPWSEFEALRREMDRAFNNAERGHWGFPFSRYSFLPAYGARRYPLINMREDADKVQVEALAPGIDPESLKVSVIENQLVIEGTKPRINGEVKPESFHRNERAAGSFVRSIGLPGAVKVDKVSADYKNGLLTITLPKAEEAKPRQISVKVK